MSISSTPQLKTSSGPKGSRILSVGSARGENIVPNDDLVDKIDSSDEWIRQRTGIVTRRRADENTSALDLAATASKEALNKAAIVPDKIGTVIVATVTHPYTTPSLATALTDMIGTSDAAAYDISAACAGYCYGIAQADSLIRSGATEYVLVVGVEKLSDIIDNTERTISFLLGDGAGAVVIGPSDTPGISQTVWGSDGSKWDAIGMTHSLLDIKKISDNSLEETVISDPQKLWPTLRQDGPSVFRWAVWEMAKVAQKALDAAGVSADDISAFIPHQANMRIIDELAKQLKLPENVIRAQDIADTGNTSSASIPLAMETLLKENPQLSGQLALQIGFGAGLVYAAQVVILP